MHSRPCLAAYNGHFFLAFVCFLGRYLSERYYIYKSIRYKKQRAAGNFGPGQRPRPQQEQAGKIGKIEGRLQQSAIKELLERYLCSVGVRYLFSIAHFALFPLFVALFVRQRYFPLFLLYLGPCWELAFKKIEKK